MSLISNHPAFPVSTADERTGHQDGPNTWQFTGLSIRDYFAAKAMQSAFGNPIASSAEEKGYIARHAYAMADAMLSAREATK